MQVEPCQSLDFVRGQPCNRSFSNGRQNKIETPHSATPKAAWSASH